MGCDIHLHGEVKIDGKWLHYSQPRIPRSYRLFTKMANVRSYDEEIEPICLPRGLPEDLSEMTAFEAEHWGSDGHSHSWLGSEEIQELEEWLSGIHRHRFAPWDYLFSNTWGGFHRYRQEFPKQLEDIRFVFWFDN